MKKGKKVRKIYIRTLIFLLIKFFCCKKTLTKRLESKPFREKRRINFRKLNI